ncbi:apcomplexan conserved protein [Cryptosporidium ryanae]|uniref:apcomplexan conserved protein n=1 Tax=Cryptosporidium ryanae TaxID=515981 RepID=UPI00351A31F9|nr:apcomplexan conserved protein [Cryptosporidium ryanae]
MATFEKENEAKDRFRPGDVFQGYYFPGVLCGRTICYYKDLTYLLGKYKRKIRNMEHIINFREPGTFSVMSNVYKEVNFSSIQFCAEIEESSECFQILIGVVLRLLNKKLDLEALTETDSEDTEGATVGNDKINTSHIKRRKTSFSTVNKESIINKNNNEKLNDNSNDNSSSMDLKVSMIIMQSLEDLNNDPDSTSPQGENYKTDNDLLLKDPDFHILHHNVSLIYILYLLYKSQYMVCLEDSFSDLEISNFQRIPITIETFNVIKNIIENCISRGDIFPEVKQIVYQMIDDDILEINLYDGPQYYYQDRYGNPLMPDPLEKRFADVESIYLNEKINDTLEDYGKFLDYLKNLNSKLLDKIIHISESRVNVSNNEVISSNLNESEDNILSNFKLLHSELSDKIIKYERNYSRYKQNYCNVYSTSSILVNSNDNASSKTNDSKVVNIDNNCDFYNSFNKNSYNYVDWEELFTNSNKLNDKQTADYQEKTRAIILDLDDNININDISTNKDSKNKDVDVIENKGTCIETQYTDIDNHNNDFEYNNSISTSNDDSLKSLLDRIERLVNREII